MGRFTEFAGISQPNWDQIRNQRHPRDVAHRELFAETRENLKHRLREDAGLEGRRCRLRTWNHRFPKSSAARNRESPRGFRRKIHPSSVEIPAHRWNRNLEFRQKSQEDR
jgi:hypothetical protein